MKKLFLLFAFVAAAFAQPIPPTLKKPCTLTTGTNCTPQVNGAGTYVPAAGGVPSGTAGGSLSGTYPNPGVVGFTAGTADPATCTAGVTLDFFNKTSGAWKYCSATNTWSAGRSVIGRLSAGTTALGSGQERSILADGAVCGSGDATAAITATLAASKYAVVPACAAGFALTGVSIPADTSLILLPGAILKTSGTILVNASNSRLLGWTSGIASTTGATGYNILWTGAANGIVVGIAESGSPVGVSVDGISVHGADTSGVEAFRFGQGNGGPAWSWFSNLSAYHVGTGFHIVAAMQQCHLEWITVMDYAIRGIYVEGNVGLGGAITTIYIDHWTVETPDVSPASPAIDIGGASGNGAAHVVISNGTMEIAATQVGVNLAAGGPFEIFSNFFEGASNATSFVVGRASGFAFMPNIFANTIQGAATHFDMRGWRNPRIHDNFIGNYTGETVFLRTGGGLYTFGGRWVDNQLDGGMGTEVSGGTAGFDLFVKENPDSSSSIPAPNYGFASTATVTPPTFTGNLAVTGSVTATPASGDAGTFNGRLHIAAPVSSDLFQFTGTNGDAYVDMNSAQHLFLRTVQVSSSGTTARNSPVFIARGNRWNGSASVNLDGTFQFKPNATLNSSRWAWGFPDVNDQMFNVFYSGGATLGNTTDPGANNLSVTGTVQGGITATDPGCTTTAHVGKQWFDITTTTTVYKVCLNVAGTLTWVTK